jgi:isopropylmalate/homocitrate/citramalate synthase
MVFEYAQLKGDLNGMDTTVITELAEYYEKEIGYKVPSRTPFVGKNFNVTRAGIHADGLLKNEEIYNIFDTKAVLGKSPKVMISNTSGVSGIAVWLNGRYRLKGDKAVSKLDPLVVYLKEWVDSEYDAGRVTAISDGELDEKIAIYCAQNNRTLI